jgi:hypothetical protein
MRIVEFGDGSSLGLGEVRQPFAEDFVGAFDSPTGELAGENEKPKIPPSTRLVSQASAVSAVNGDRFGLAAGTRHRGRSGVQLNDDGRVLELDFVDVQTRFGGY